MQTKIAALLVVASTADLSTKEGYFLQPDGTLPTAATDVPLGVIVDGRDKSADVAVPPGAPGIFHVKLSGTPGTVNRGTYLVLHTDGSAKADGGTGARVRVARALESGAADELISAVLLAPQVLS